MKIIEYLQLVKNVPEWDRVPAISNKELDGMLNMPPWDDPASECFGCKEHSVFDCEKCVR